MNELEYRVAGKRRESLEEEDERSELLEVFIEGDEEVNPEEDPAEVKTKDLHSATNIAVLTQPWLGWCFTYAFALLIFSAYRWSTLSALIIMYGGEKDNNLSQCKHQGGRRHAPFDIQYRVARTASNVITFVVSWVLFVALVSPFVADLVLVHLREMRFSLDIIELAINERDYISAAPIAAEEFNAGYVNAAAVGLVATFFALVRVKAPCANLAVWNPTQALVCAVASRVITRRNQTKTLSGGLDGKTINGQGYKYDKLAPTEGIDVVETPNVLNVSMKFDVENAVHQRVSQAAVVLTSLVLFPMLVFSVSSSSSPLVAYSALNVTLNQLFTHSLLPTVEKMTRGDIDSTRLEAWAETYIHHQTEEHELFGDNSLYRRTTGFRGDLAFDVNIDPENPPNVMLLAIESFRYHDSRYLVGQDDPSNLFKGSNISVTPSFDRWAKRGVAFRKHVVELPDKSLPGKYIVCSSVHDDISFQLVGDLLLNKTKKQNERLAQGQPKKPTFITHFTISSHEPFHARPTWYAEMEKPDFSALYEGLERAAVVKDYLEMRYFTDMELGKFMDRMEKEGVLNDTIVIIVGDHGRGPEVPNSDTRDISVTRVPAAIIAESRLGESVGLVLDDAVEQYDLLNTLADITGVPEGGFLQDGVGRSLKRKIPFGERVVFSNNPTRKMSVVRGHQRLQYDRVADSVLLHNADTDHDMHANLFLKLTTDEQTEWLIWRDIGRDISRYYLERWHGKCLLAVNCTDS
ncbi:unnamed protein product [Phytophthora lilii]|uniref:Unnamed protein product n=1 Tax=Phytophthora lilii TaxID=2077276 RepID=A0A9W7CKB8_9STRA|nr:unnamed protein product [Phytophthora lilii]